MTNQGDMYSVSTRSNAITSLAETFVYSPIGSTLEMGIPIASGNSYKFNKQGWSTPDGTANYLDYIRIPGCVYASLDGNWAGTVATLHDLSANKWVSYSNEEKRVSR